ncbi:glycosyl transferase [Fulvivirga sp. 29W222]|uniref:Glycosyl transferase n=1 Tax=Fulvivirga marina TaxID=2494733 RepID=A0A937KDX8_9BACT|nr:glycosyltransferase family protein [Fulvivirga marina]MBL6448939.1 glycosyl transferase [Fulvivirga marina]
MKILYAIQGTGNGHVSRAMDIGPELEKYGEVDYLVSGAQVEISLPKETKYRSEGLSFYFGKKGGINLSKTLKSNSSRRFLKEIKDFPIDNYDLIINDFEPITAWASRLKGKRCVALSHQSALLSAKCPKPESKDVVGQMILRNYAPASVHYGFHFNAFDENIYTPVVRRSIREAKITNKGHYTVYLPAYADEKIVEILSKVKKVNWEVFSKHNKEGYEEANVKVSPINNQRFIDSITSAEGVLCGAGFETPSEALFLGKKLMVIPMKNQYEQQCNAAAMEEMGIPVLKKLKKKYVDEIKDWAYFRDATKIEYPDETEAIISHIVEKEAGA